MELFAQIMGILAAIIAISSFQVKNNVGFYAMQGLSGLCFAVNFFLLGSYTSAAFNVLNIVRGLGFAFEKNKKPNITLFGMWIIYIAVTVLTYSGPLSAIICIAQILSTFGMWTRDAKKMRIMQFFAASPLWLVNNIVVGSVGATVCEIFNMCSIIVFFIRVNIIEKKFKKA